MRLLDVPHTHYQLEYQVSLTGITKLKENQYRDRHKLSSEFVQIPGKGIVLKKNLPADHCPLSSRTSQRTRNNHREERPKVPERKERKYAINKTKVRHRILGYVNAMRGKKKLYFWTVTFPKGTPDTTGMLLLNKWLTRLRQENRLHDYLWIAERQENKTIHFHIAIPHKMCVKRANKYMRACLFTCIHNGEISWTRSAAVKYNGVDLAKDRKTKRVINFANQKRRKTLTNYLTKYMAKADDKFDCLAWHCSRAFSMLVTSFRLTYFEFIQPNFQPYIKPQPTFENEYIEFRPYHSNAPPHISQYLADINNFIAQLN